MYFLPPPAVENTKEIPLKIKKFLSFTIVLNNAKILLKSENTDSNDTIKGDVNTDGKFNVADIVLLKKWLLAVPDIELADPKSADLCEDGKLNVFDLCMMKYEIINES